MAPSRRRGSTRAAAAAAAAAALQQWKVGDLVLAKMKGFPAWPAMISEPEKWGFSSDRKKLLVYFYGTKQIAFCNYADIEAFTEEKKKSLLLKRQGKGADFVRALEEIIDVYESQTKQSLAKANSSDRCNDDNASNKEHMKDSGISCFGNTVAPSLSSCLNHELEDASITECCGMESMEDNPVASPDFCNKKENAVVDGSAKKMSILDQLRKTPLSSISTTRKRARDAHLRRCITKSASSLRRSRSSLINKPLNSQKSSLRVDVKLDIPASDVMLQEPTLKEQVVREHPVTCSVDASSIATGVQLDGNVLECNGKFGRSDNETGSKSFLDGDVRLILKDEIPSNTLVIKARRKPYRNQVTNGRSWGEIDKEIDVQTEDGSLSDSQNTRNGVTCKFSNPDGDGHLPLVKRARVRMGKAPVKEELLNETMGSQVKLGSPITSNEHYESTTFSNLVNNYPLKTEIPKWPSPVAKDVTSSTNGSAYDVSGGNQLSNKAHRYHQMLDVEAALPPSKRLHRALEAMSANAAEAAIDSPEVPNNTKTRSSDWLGSVENVHVTGNSVWSTMKPLTQFSGTPALDKNACVLFSSLTPQNLADCFLTSSEEKSDVTHSKTVLNSLQKDLQEIKTGRNCYHETFTSKVNGTSMSSSLELVEKCTSECGLDLSLSPVLEENNRFQLDTEFSYSQCVRVSPKGSDICNSQQLSDLSPSGGAATALSTTSTVCSVSDVDGAGAVSDVLNIDASITDMNSIPLVSSARNVYSSASCINGGTAPSLATNCSSTTNDNSKATTSSRSNFYQSYGVRDMQNVGLEVKKTFKDRSILPKLAPIKDLIAAAQAKRVLYHPSSSCDSFIDGKVAPNAAVSPTLLKKEDVSVRGSPSNSMFCHGPASDDRFCYLQNGSKTPIDGSSRKGLSKHMNQSEANAARRCFESLLCTLSRTKESIGRATRLAIDCAKFGIAGEVIDILLRYLEKESSLHRRIDLFFLVDSITQCSRCQKGGAADVYPSLVQAVLPRLLSAAAPPGNAAAENRRQCLKVLRLWLERKTLPEFVIRHHIRELEYGSEASLSISYSRRPPRTERPLNDPVREMEGMLVDEYGSNASFRLPHFLSAQILEDDEGCASDEKDFEAVTPDMNTEVDYEKETTPISSNKHRLVLEDVDGELEMEDVAPPCEQDPCQSTCRVKGDEMASNCSSKCEQDKLLFFAPPLPEERPPSPPPLPSSPPPCATAIGQAHSLPGDNTDFNPSSANYNAQNRYLLHASQQTENLHCSSSLSELASYSQGYVDHPQLMQHLVSSCTSSGTYGVPGGSLPSMPVGNNSISIVSMPSTNKVYHLQPPPPVVSNQFSYIQAQLEHRPQPPGSQSTYPDRFLHGHDIQRANFFGDGDSRGSVQVDLSDKGAFLSSVRAGPSGSAPDMVEAPLAPAYYSPRMDQSSAASQDWPYPHRTSTYPPPSRPTLEKPVSGVAEAPAYWRAR